MTWDEVHEEAEHMEHAVSDLLVDRIDKFLGYPSVDPHGDPIPRSDGTLLNPATISLAETSPGQRFKITRVLDQSPEFLRFLTNSGLALDALGTTIAKKQEAGLLVVRIADQETSLGMPAADKIQVVEL
jgi:DtxR family Mn-dependent transcriptional regulator